MLTNRVKIPDERRTFTYSHLLWLFEAYAKVLKKKSKTKEEKDETTCLDKLIARCFKEDQEVQKKS